MLCSRNAALQAAPPTESRHQQRADKAERCKEWWIEVVLLTDIYFPVAPGA